MDKQSTMKELYATYTGHTARVGVKTKAFSSFKNRAELQDAIQSLLSFGKVPETPTPIKGHNPIGVFGGYDPLAAALAEQRAAALEAEKSPINGNPVVVKAPSVKEPKTTVEIKQSLTKVQRAMARRWYDRNNLARPGSWVGAKVPTELAKAMGL